MNKIALVTAVFGGIDFKKQIPEQTVPADSYFFDETNDIMSLPAGETVGHFNDRTRALYYKTQLYKVAEADVYIWVDGKIEIISPIFVESILWQLSKWELAILKHDFRHCVYEEVDHIENCIQHGNEYLATRYAHRPIRREVEWYRQQGYPVNNGLNDCKILAMRNTRRMQILLDQWWAVCRKQWFDQVAIQFIAWKNGIKIKTLNLEAGKMYLDHPHQKMK